MIALAKALARDYGKLGVRVNSVAPGSILFPGGGWERRQQADPAGIAAMVERELPLGRFGTVEEVAECGRVRRVAARELDQRRVHRRRRRPIARSSRKFAGL